MRDERQMARLQLDRRRAHAFGHKSLEIGVNRAVFRRDGIEARLRMSSGVLRFSGQQRLVKRLLHRIEFARFYRRQIAAEVAQECRLRQSALVAVEHDSG